ncbi:MAG TPA: NlpC/P60 family protein [Mucilaginibacter sp.]|nr:NlpC/P60 family protein [Mucilaginibacter sp.]
MNKATQNKLLITARTSIGVKHSALDCSHFVQRAYQQAGMSYPYMSSAAFGNEKNNKYFAFVGKNLSSKDLQDGDVIVFGGHMGIWDPQGCNQITIPLLGATAECARLKNNAPFLSSRGDDTRDVGVEYGRTQWWGDYKVFRWGEK